MTADQHQLLSVAAERASKDPFFMGHELRAYKEIFGLDDKGLASFLRCTTEALTRLALCRRPKMTSSLFRQEIEQIATYCSADEQRLAELLRHTDSVRSFREMPIPVPMVTPAGMMIAARDRRKRRARKKKP